MVLAGGAPAHAQGLLLPRPVAQFPHPQPLAVRSQKVGMAITDGVLKVDVEQVFYNPNGVQLEGTYLFPLPAGATVSSFRMTVDREPVEGKLLSVDEARQVYESYVRRAIDPAILEYVGRNAFQARVFPIPPGGEKHIFLSYSQPAEFAGGIYRVTYPLNSERVTGAPVGELSVDCTIRSREPIKAVYSPSHEVQVKRESDHLARVTFQGREVRADRDFVLYYTISEKAFGLNALAYRRMGEDGYAMLMLAPKREVAASEVQPKDILFVFDTSGSMEGQKIEQAKKALQTVLGALNERDRFNIIRFSTDVTSFRNTVVPANSENRAAARGFVDDLKAIGGTAIDEALETAFASLPKPGERQGRAAFVVFMTDGLPTVGVTDPAQILEHVRKEAPADVRFFAFGVGEDVNTFLLDKLCDDHRGAADYVADNESLETKIGSFYAKIADPVLSNVKLTVEGAQLSDVYPSRIPDLFAGTQLLVLGRYRSQGDAHATVALTGELNGHPQRYTYDMLLPEREPANDFIPKLWGSRRIGFLLEQIRLNGESKELKDEVIRLSKEYGILTPYTSYLVEEPGLQPPGGPVQLAPLAYQIPALGGGGGFGGGGFGGGLGAPASGGFTPVPLQSQKALSSSPQSSGLSVAHSANNRDYNNNPTHGHLYRESTELGRFDLTKKAPASKTRSAAAGRSAAGKPAAVPQLRGMAGRGSADSTTAGTHLNYKSQSGPAGPSGPPGPAGPFANVPQTHFAYNGLQQQVRQQADGFRRSTGWNAVEASRRVRELKDSTRAKTDVETTRTIGGRSFRFENGGWVDAGVTPKLRVVSVKYRSDAYFQVMSARPEWARLLAAGARVTFRTGPGTAVTIGPAGKEKLTPEELSALAR